MLKRPTQSGGLFDEDVRMYAYELESYCNSLEIALDKAAAQLEVLDKATGISNNLTKEDWKEWCCAVQKN